jgi:hypothetical protein
MWLHVLQADALGSRYRRQRTNLVNDKIFDVAWCDIELASPKTLEIGKSRVGAYGNIMGSSQRDRSPHDGWAAGVKAARDVRRRDLGHQYGVLPKIPDPALTDVGVQVDPHACQQYTLVILATRLKPSPGNKLRFSK